MTFPVSVPSFASRLLTTAALAVTAALLLPATGSAQQATRSITPSSRVGTPPPAATPAAGSSPAAKAPSTRPFPYDGNIASSDSSAKTFTLQAKSGNTRVFQVTPQTKLTKRDGSAATFGDLAKGQFVSGTTTKAANGQYQAASVIVGQKPAAASSPAPKGATPAPKTSKKGAVPPAGQ